MSTGIDTVPARPELLARSKLVTDLTRTRFVFNS
jgi:hypothetical protein